MNSSKPIDISKSSLVSLKAELSRKQEEVSSVKANKASNYVCPTINPNQKPLPAVKSKFSKNVEKNAEDGSSSVAEENTKALEHSRNVLEIKSKLYDELKEGRLVSEKGRGAEYLVDFTQKTSEKGEDASSRENEDDQEQNVSEDDDEDDRPSDPEEDWVDYTDLVGRQRRCLRRDLEAMRARDADSLLPPPPSPPPPPVGCFDDDASAAQRTKHEAQAATAAPHIEAMRRQWRKQEEKLLEKNSVHYEDLLFNEARTHGVGYYAFSTDETERERQMRELERRREETLRRQDDAEGLRARRDMQLKARLQAAKARNRQRLGLPPLAPEQQEDEGKDDVVSEEQSDQNKTDDDSCKKDELEAALKRAAHIRPWDAEKLGLKIVGGDQPAVMSQGEWVDMKREERISEFAPPEMYNQIRKDATIEPKGDDLSASQPSESRTLFFTSKRPKAADFFKQQQQPQTSTEEYQSPGQSKSWYRTEEQSTNRYRTEEQSTNRYRTQEPSNSSQCSDRFVDDEEPVKRKRTEIPPPLTAEYFGGTSKPKQKPLSKSSGVGESISEGLKYLNEQKKAKDHKRDKGLLDII